MVPKRYHMTYGFVNKIMSFLSYVAGDLLGGETDAMLNEFKIKDWGEDKNWRGGGGGQGVSLLLNSFNMTSELIFHLPKPASYAGYAFRHYEVFENNFKHLYPIYLYPNCNY